MALTKTYTIEVDGQKAQATVGQIKAEIERLEAEVENATLGTRELEAKMLELGRAKGALKELDDAVDALNPKAMAGAYMDFANGMVGAFGVATVAAESFGLASGGSAEEVEKKMLQLMTVMQSFEALHKALNSETQSAMKNLLASASTQIKSVLSMGNSWTVAGVKAKLFGTTTRAALTATGIGALVVALGMIIANWDLITRKVGEFKDSVARAFPAIGQFIDTVVAKLRDIASVLSFGFIDDAATAAVRKVEEAEKKMTEGRIAARKRLINEEAAAGRSTYNLKQQQLFDELKLLEKETEEYKDKWSEIRALKAAHDKSLADAADKAAKEALEKQKAASEKAYQLAREAYDKRRALEAAAFAEAQAQLDEIQKRKYEQAKLDGKSQQELLRIEIETLQLSLVEKKRYSSEWLAIQNQIAEKEKAIVAATTADLQKAQETKKRLQEEELARLDTDSQKRLVYLELQGASERELTQETIQGLQQRLAAMRKMGLDTTLEYAQLLLELKKLEDGLLNQKESLLDKLLLRLIPDEKLLDKVKASLTESVAVIYDSISQLSDSMVGDALLKLDAYTEYLDEQLSLAQERQQAADQALNDSMQRRQQLEEQLENSRGAKREHLLKQIAKERQEEAKLTAEKKKAAAEQARIEKQKEEAEKKRQELEAKGQLLAAATTTANNIATASSAVRAGVDAVAGANKLPFPANLAAMVAALASVAAAVMSAKKLGQTMQAAKLKTGGELDGPSHESGGIRGTGRFANVEVEGGEFVVAKGAYRNNIDAIRRINAIGNSVRFVAVPEYQVRRKFATGGELPGGGEGADAAVRGDSMPMSAAELQAIRAVLERIEQHTARSADKEPGYIGPWESRKIVDQAKNLDRDEQAGKLL